ncbi:MAG: prepilin peptidase [Paracoccaceae bacterium]|nr:prepilin peptidase [Paracoccaceae bacterium]
MFFPAHAALALLPFALAIGIWVAWSDMKFMRIPNQSVLALLAVFVLLGPVLFPFKTYLWQLSHFAALLVFGFVLNMARAIGAGDAKFVAAMGPFLATQDMPLIVILTSSILLAAFATHRGLRLVPAVRRATGDWESWARRDFPMGFALAGILIFYLLLATILGQ